MNIHIFSDLSGYKWCVKHFDENVTALVNNNMKMKDPVKMAKAGKAIRSLYTTTTFNDRFGGLVRVSKFLRFLLITVTFCHDLYTSELEKQLILIDIQITRLQNILVK